MNICQKIWPFVLGVVGALSLSETSHGSGQTLETLLAEARARRLATASGWLRLLHYRDRLLGAASSDVDGRSFFLATSGHEDARAELEATLRAFFEPSSPSRPDFHAACRFPARWQWLDRELGQGKLTKPRCPALERFLRAQAALSVSLVYAANWLDYPASAFGHTFLYLKQRTPHLRHAAANLHGLGVDYQANTDTGNPILYAVKGLAGLFRGRVKLHPAEEKMREYTEEQDRDLWEFELALTQQEVHALVLHLWELSQTHIDYFYLSENCSFHMLTMLEAAAPRLALTQHLKFVVLPVDTVKALFETPRLVRRVRYIPARHSRRRPSIPWQESPERAHGTMRLTFGSGVASEPRSAFGTLGFRIALHDLEDSTDGEPELAQVQFLDTHLRLSQRAPTLRLEHLTFAELFALNPVDEIDARPSWRARGYALTIRDGRCRSQSCFAHGLNASLGAALGDADLALFLMQDASLLFSADFSGIADSFISPAIGIFSGVRIRFSSDTLALLTTTWSYLPGQKLRHTYVMHGGLRSKIGPDVALGVEAELAPAALQAQVLSLIYF